MNQLTVVITTYNRPVFLHKALESVFAAFGKGTKCIIGDNGNHDITSKLLEDNSNYHLSISHVKNPSGGSYMTNLDSAVTKVTTEWMSLLHDDDFYMENCGEVISEYLGSEKCDFIFSDHWVSSNNGDILKFETESISNFYKKDKLKQGRISNVTALAIKQAVCLDGFFVRTDLIKGIKIDTSKYLSDFKWVIEICQEAKNAVFLSNRLFVYRLNETGLTASGAIDLMELTNTMIDLYPKIKDNSDKLLIKKKILFLFWSNIKFSIKRFKFFRLIKSSKPVLNFFYNSN